MPATKGLLCPQWSAGGNKTGRGQRRRRGQVHPWSESDSSDSEADLVSNFNVSSPGSAVSPTDLSPLSSPAEEGAEISIDEIADTIEIMELEVPVNDVDAESMISVVSSGMPTRLVHFKYKILSGHFAAWKS